MVGRLRISTRERFDSPESGVLIGLNGRLPFPFCEVITLNGPGPGSCPLAKPVVSPRFLERGLTWRMRPPTLTVGDTGGGAVPPDVAKLINDSATPSS